MSAIKRLKADDGEAASVTTNDAALALKKDIAGLLVRNYKASEIARQLNITNAKTNAYIEAIRDEWSQLTSSTFKEFQSQELLKLEQIEREAWIAWEASKKKKIRRKKTYARTGDEIITELSDSGMQLEVEVIDEFDDDGDTKYLDVVMKAMAHRAKILGVDKVNVNVFSANININQEQPEYQQRVDQFLAQFGGDYGRIINAALDRDRVDEPVDTEGKYSISEASIVPDEN